MASVSISGDTSGTITLSAPAVANNTVLTLPSVSGSVLTDQSSLNYTGFKNRIINGAMQIAQRNTSSNVGGYSCLDRWYFNYGGTGITASQTTATLNGAVVNVLQIAGAAGNTAQNFNQKIEAKNSYDLVGQNVSVSFWCYQTTGGTFSLQTSLSYANSADNFSSVTLIGTANTTSIPNATWTYVSFTVSSLPLGVANGLLLSVFANSPTLTSGVFQFAFVQIEKGSTATSFDYRPYGTELALCQRYYEITQPTQVSGSPASTTVVFFVIPFIVPKRATPTISGNGGTISYYQSSSNSNFNGGGLSINSGASTQGLALQCGAFTGLTVGSYGYLGGTSTQLSFTAEL